MKARIGIGISQPIEQSLRMFTPPAGMRALVALCTLFGLVARLGAAEDPARQAAISQEVAARTALEKIPGGKIQSAELERERGRLVWSFDITIPGSPNVAEIQVDARSGKIVSNRIETPAEQAREAAAEKKEPKPRK